MFDARLLSRPSVSKQRFVQYVALDRVQCGAESTTVNLVLPVVVSSAVVCVCTWNGSAQKIHLGQSGG